MDLDLQQGEAGGVSGQSFEPLQLDRLGLLAEDTEEVVLGGDLRAGLGLETHVHG
jgi:hypothetical protein